MESKNSGNEYTVRDKMYDLSSVNPHHPFSLVNVKTQTSLLLQMPPFFNQTKASGKEIKDAQT